MAQVMHPEEVKAAIRIRHGTLKQFAEDAQLTEDQVRDYLRGRSSTAHDAVAKLLKVAPKHLVLRRPVPIRGLDSANAGVTHDAKSEVLA